MDRRRFLQVSAAGAVGTAAAVALPESMAGAAAVPAPPAAAAQPATAAPSISKIGVTGPLQVLIDVTGNKNHNYVGGHPHGLWLDGPMNVYRGPTTKFLDFTFYGTQFAIFPHAQNFRFNVGNYENGGSFGNPQNVRDANYDLVESHYDYASWLFGCWAEGNTVHAIAHHEWHLDTVPVDGIPFPAATKPEWRYTTRAIKWYKSTDLGRTWEQKVPGDAGRLYAVPEAYNKRKASTIYGWLQPSANIVKEGNYYYFTAQAYNLPRNGKLGHGLLLVTAGFSLFRMSNLDNIDSVEFYNTDKQWEKRAPHGYQGSLSPQQPHIFFARTDFDAYGKDGHVGAKPRAAQCIRHHLPTSQWLIFGYQDDVSPAASYGRSATLADPQFEKNGLATIHIDKADGSGDYTGDAYMNVFSPKLDPTDQNLMNIDNNPMLVVGYNRYRYRHQTLDIQVTPA
jgi:hypothetical protein